MYEFNLLVTRTMDEALKKIERLLSEQSPKSRIGALLPTAAVQPQTAGEDMAITHLSKGGAAKPETAPPSDIPAAPPREFQSPREQPRPDNDLYKKITAGGKEFSLDELGGAEGGTEVVDPLMGPVLKPASSYRDMSLDELDVNIKPDDEQSGQ
ncbi:MAG: hypothetical protein QME74_10010 [Candidatus Edwardsbacteria bacterium]|nr:hypothetical protein [Candidatus Edwardsbacteria bacterium]